jgi:hypothetical protein
MFDADQRRLSPEGFAALRAEVARAAVELSDEQLMDLTDTLHGLMRLRRPAPPSGRPSRRGLEEESPYFS